MIQINFFNTASNDLKSCIKKAPVCDAGQGLNYGVTNKPFLYRSAAVNNHSCTS